MAIQLVDIPVLHVGSIHCFLHFDNILTLWGTAALIYGTSNGPRFNFMFSDGYHWKSVYSNFPQGKGTFDIGNDLDQNTRELRIICVRMQFRFIQL